MPPSPSTPNDSQAGHAPTPGPAQLIRAVVVWLAVLGAIVGLLVVKRGQERNPASRGGPVAAPAAATANVQPHPLANVPSKKTAPTRPPEAAPSDDDKVAWLINEANRQLGEGQYSEAIALLEQASRVKPDDESVRFNLGIALSRQGKLDQARQAYEEALRIFPDYAEAHINLGNLLVRQNRMSEALEHLQAAVKAAPESASAHNNLGSALARQGQVPAAIPHFQEAIRLQTNYLEAILNLGHAHLQQGHPALAIEKYQEILRQQPDYEPARKGLERAQRRQAGGP